MTAEFDKMMNMDPLGEAEKMTGLSYKDDEETMHLGMLLHMAKNKAVANEMALRNDTHLGISWDDALAIYEDLGFVEIFSEDFVDHGFYEDEKPKTECYKVFWRNGFLLTAESYYNQSAVNSSKLYYNWIPAEGLERTYAFTSSGGFDWTEDDVKVWGGDHDARVGLRNIIDNLERNGEILDEWLFPPLLWMVNFSVTKDEDYSFEQENERLIAQFPEDIQKAINFGKQKRGKRF